MITTWGSIFPLTDLIGIITHFSLVCAFLTIYLHDTDGSSHIPIARRCNEDREFLAADATPVPPAVQSRTDWFPFNSCVGFELADFIFTEVELPRKKIDHLLELLAATLVPHGAASPIADHKDLLQQIDSIPLGNIPWESFSLSYDEPLPKTTHRPEWMTTEYEVWFRNPCEVIKGILSNPEFNSHIDYSMYREFNDLTRWYSNMMSGDWAWQQSVCHVARRCMLPPLIWDRT